MSHRSENIRGGRRWRWEGLQSAGPWSASICVLLTRNVGTLTGTLGIRTHVQKTWFYSTSNRNNIKKKQKKTPPFSLHSLWKQVQECFKSDQHSATVSWYITDSLLLWRWKLHNNKEQQKPFITQGHSHLLSIGILKINLNPRQSCTCRILKKCELENITSINLSLYLSAYVSIYLSICLSDCICLSFSLFLYTLLLLFF